MFDKDEQRARLAQYEKDQLSKGFKQAPALNVPITKVFVKTKVAKPQKLSYEVLPFTNHLGQVINPGDDVIMMASGYNHNTKVRKGIYLGVRMNYGKVSSVSLSYEANVSKWDSVKRQRVDLGLKTVRTSLPGKRIYPTK